MLNKPIFNCLFLALFLTVGQGVCQSEPAPPLPLASPDDSWKPLYERIDPELQAALEGALNKNHAWKKLIDKKKMAVGVVDLSTPEAPRFARVNGRVMMYAASLPKIAILLAAHVAMEEGRLEDSPEVEADLAAMIRKSSNQAATRIIDLVGLDNIEKTLKDARFGLYDEGKGGGLWVGKRYAKTGKRHGDPLKGVSHGATVTQVCRFYYLLANGRVINPERSRRMLDTLSDPGLHHKFVGVLEELAPKAKLFRKSGTWKNWHSDSVLVWGPIWRRYILAALIEDENGEHILKDLVPVIENLIHPEPISTPL